MSLGSTQPFRRAVAFPPVAVTWPASPPASWLASGSGAATGWPRSCPSADMMVALFVPGAIGIVMALGIKQVEARLLRWRPENRRR